MAKAVHKSEQTVKLWLLEDDFYQLLRKNAARAALRIIVERLGREPPDKEQLMVALALLRMNKPASPPRNGPRRPVSEDETDIDGFSEDQLKRLTGDAWSIPRNPRAG